MVKFESEDDYCHVLYEGPWMVADYYILILWHPNFLKSARKESKVVVWVCIHELPLEHGSILGILVKVNQFTRISVEVDLPKPLIPQVEVRAEIINLGYERLHFVYFNCGVYGHQATACPVPTHNMVVPATQEGGGNG